MYGSKPDEGKTMENAMKDDKKTTGGQTGFSLVEVLVATLVLAVGLLTIAAAFAQGMLALAATPAHITAKEVAASVVDELTVRMDAGQSLPSTMPSRRICQSNGVCQDYEVAINVTGNVDGINGLSSVEVTVSYTASGMRRSYVKTINLGS